MFLGNRFLWWGHNEAGLSSLYTIAVLPEISYLFSLNWDANYNASSDKPVTSITPPIKWRLPVTRIWTGFGETVDIFSTSLMACSIDGKTWIWEGSKAGNKEDQAKLRACWVLSSARSAVGIAFVVKSKTKWSIVKARTKQKHCYVPPLKLPLAYVTLVQKTTWSKKVESLPSGNWDMVDSLITFRKLSPERPLVQLKIRTRRECLNKVILVSPKASSSEHTFLQQ